MDQEDEWIFLEDIHGAEPLAWVGAHNEKALAALKADPLYAGDFEYVLAILDAEDRIPYVVLRDGRTYNYWQDAAHPKGLWRVTGAADYAQAAPVWHVLLDLDALAAAEGENWVWHGASVSPAQTRALISLSRGGGDAVVIREYDLTAGRFVPDGFHLPEAKSEAVWLDDDRVLFGTDFGPGSMTHSGYPRVIKLWKRGQNLDAARVIFEGASEDIGVSAAVWRRPEGETALIVRMVSFFEAEYRLINSDFSLTLLDVPLSLQVAELFEDQLLVTPRSDWAVNGGTVPQGALASFSLKQAYAQGGRPGPVSVLYAPGPRASIDGVAANCDALYVTIYENVRGRVLCYRWKGGAWSAEPVALPYGGAPFVAAVDLWSDDVQVGYTDYLTPPTLFAKQDSALRAIKSLPARFDASGFIAEQFEARSQDGTLVPYTVLHVRGQQGPRPTILYGYGGFEVSLTPDYAASAGALWLARGGAYVIANIRGGGEFGPAWHEAARKQNRQRAFDDFIAVAEDLIARGFATPSCLGIMGGSNGGLLVTAAMVQRPDLFGAVVCQVPLIDMLAYTRIGAGASWESEYGDPEKPEERSYIARYSPYQNLRADVRYPPVFFVTATSDDRVTPVHARKMAARMEAHGHDVLFYENMDGGHAAAADHRQQAEMSALTFAFFRRTLNSP